MYLDGVGTARALNMVLVRSQVDGTLLLFFAGLFFVTHGVAQAGITERIHAAPSPLFGATATQQTFRFGLFTVAACQLVLMAVTWALVVRKPSMS